MKTRICTKCEENKPITDFHKDTKGAGGYATRCKICKNNSKKLSQLMKNADAALAKVKPKDVSKSAREFAFRISSESQRRRVQSLQSEIVPEEDSKRSKAHSKVEDFTHRILITGEKSILDKLSEKYSKPKTLTWSGKRAILQIMGSPVLVFRDETPEKVFEKALSYQN
jgi:gas vesicle protein